MHDKNDQEKLVLFSPSTMDKMTSQATSVELDPIPPVLLGHFLFRSWRTATEEKHGKAVVVRWNLSQGGDRGGLETRVASPIFGP